MRRLHPLRLQYEVFADGNPFAPIVAKGADWARSNRPPVSAGNSFLACEQARPARSWPRSTPGATCATVSPN